MLWLGQCGREKVAQGSPYLLILDSIANVQIYSIALHARHATRCPDVYLLIRGDY